MQCQKYLWLTQFNGLCSLNVNFSLKYFNMNYISFCAYLNINEYHWTFPHAMEQVCLSDKMKIRLMIDIYLEASYPYSRSHIDFYDEEGLALLHPVLHTKLGLCKPTSSQEPQECRDISAHWKQVILSGEWCKSDLWHFHNTFWLAQSRPNSCLGLCP